MSAGNRNHNVIPISLCSALLCLVIALTGLGDGACWYEELGYCDSLVPSEFRCVAGGGVWLGEGSYCNGVCCLCDGTCLDMTGAQDTWASCEYEQGGTYMGPGTDCSACSTGGDEEEEEEEPPEPLEACCKPDGSCDRLPVSTCERQDGMPQGEGTLCANTDCSTQAYCSERESYADFVFAYKPGSGLPGPCEIDAVYWREAASHAGEVIVVKGPVLDVEHEIYEGVTLHIGGIFPDQKCFLVCITSSTVHSLEATIEGAELRDYYLGKEVLVTGKVEVTESGVPYIHRLSDPEDIRLVSESQLLDDRMGGVGGELWSLGIGGTISFSFTDNVVFNLPGIDLILDGATADNDQVFVELSEDGQRYHSCGLLPVDAQIDLDDVGLASVVIVRITDDGSEHIRGDATPGADVSCPRATTCVSSSAPSEGLARLAGNRLLEQTDLRGDIFSSVVGAAIGINADAALEVAQMQEAAQRLAQFETTKAQILASGVPPEDRQWMLVSHAKSLLEQLSETTSDGMVPVVPIPMVPGAPSLVDEVFFLEVCPCWQDEPDANWIDPFLEAILCDRCPEEFSPADARIDGISVPGGGIVVKLDETLFIHGAFGCDPGTVSLVFESRENDIEPLETHTIPLQFSEAGWYTYLGEDGMIHVEEVMNARAGECPSPFLGWTHQVIEVYVPDLIPEYISIAEFFLIENARVRVTVGGTVVENGVAYLLPEVTREYPVSLGSDLPTLVSVRSSYYGLSDPGMRGKIKSPDSILIIGSNFGEYDQEVCQVTLTFPEGSDIGICIGTYEAMEDYFGIPIPTGRDAYYEPMHPFPSGPLTVHLEWGANGDWQEFWSDNMIQVEIPELIMPTRDLRTNAYLTVRFADGSENFLPVVVVNRVLDAIISGDGFQEIDTDCNWRIGCDNRGSYESADGTTLTVWHDPGCGIEGGKGRDWFFDDFPLPPGCYVEHTSFMWVHPDFEAEAIEHWANWIHGLAKSGIEGGGYGMVKYIAQHALEGIICGISSGDDCGHYQAKEDGHYSDSEQFYGNTRAVNWWCTCLRSSEWYDDIVEYWISFYIRGPEWAIQMLRATRVGEQNTIW